MSWKMIGLALLTGIPLFGMLLFLGFYVASRLRMEKRTWKQRLELFRLWLREAGQKVQQKSGSRTSLFYRFDRMVKEAGKPFGIQSGEWFVICQLIYLSLFGLIFLQMLLCRLFAPALAISIDMLLFFPVFVTSIPILYLHSKARRRRFVLQYDFIQSFHRLAGLTNQTPYDLVKLSLAGTRLLKEYTPSASEFLHSPRKAMDRFAERVGIEEATIYCSTILYGISYPDMVSDQVLRVQLGMQKLRESEEKKNTKKLETGFTAFIYGPFLVAVIALSLPWFHYLKSSLSGLLGQ